MSVPNEQPEKLLEETVREALQGVGCCDARFGVGQLGLVHDVQVKGEGAVSVKVLPCCIFGMTRLVTSVRESLAGLEDVTSVQVDVAWDQVGNRNPAPQADQQVLQLDLETLARKHGIKPWGQ
jgi:metal-sulfur cluster biosynthetic enzyme